LERRRRLATEGCHLVLGGRSRERGTALAAELDAAFVQVDLAVNQAPGRLVDAAIERFGGLDILVNNARSTTPVTLLPRR
jgi:NAD(P)-dependent dehydrogenase (short-subunit alcohol dehydrogenase family)